MVLQHDAGNSVHLPCTCLLERDATIAALQEFKAHQLEAAVYSVKCHPPVYPACAKLEACLGKELQREAAVLEVQNVEPQQSLPFLCRMLRPAS